MSEDSRLIPYLQGNRFETPNTLKEIYSPYDQDSKLFQDLIQRGIMPIKTWRFSVAAAGSLLIDEPGFHFVIYGDDDAIATAVPAVDTTVQVNVYINQRSPAAGHSFPAKHARGFSGPFSALYLEWVAQSVMASRPHATLVVFKSKERPWIDGEAPT